MLYRSFEFQADGFAAKMGRAPQLCSGLFQIHEENKGDLNPDTWYSWYHFSHPPLVERLRALNALEGSQPSGTKKSSEQMSGVVWNCVTHDRFCAHAGFSAERNWTVGGFLHNTQSVFAGQ